MSRRAYKETRKSVNALWTGLKLRCPACTRGRLFTSFFTMRPTCACCGVHYWREAGEVTGGLYINSF